MLTKLLCKGWRYWLNLALFGLILLALGLTFGIGRLLWQSSMSYVHPPRLARPAEETPALYHIAYQDIILHTADGIELKAWYTPAQNGAVILSAHGHTGSRSPATHAFFAKHNYGVLSWDFRAHGESGGDLCTVGFSEALDVEAALDFALSQPELNAIGAYGQSMGAVAIIRAAARRPEIEAVIVDSAFPTLEKALEQRVEIALFRPIVRFFAEGETGLSVHDLRPVDDIGRISPRPVFIIQGTADQAVPPNSAEQLYLAAGEPRDLWLAPNALHVGAQTAYPQEFEQRIMAFLDQHLLD